MKLWRRVLVLESAVKCTFGILKVDCSTNYSHEFHHYLNNSVILCFPKL